MNGPHPDTRHPMQGFPQVAFIKNFCESPNIIIGDYSYYDDPDGPERFFENVLYHFDFIGDRLIIGRYCAIARGTSFIMNGGGHATGSFSTYPFYIFGSGWEHGKPDPSLSRPVKDTVLGHDVWTGYRSTIMPGVNIGHGAIVGAHSVVTRDVPPYGVVAGNPARLIRTRFPEDVVQALLRIAWWDWPVEKVTRNLPAITGCDLEALERAGY